MKESYILHVGGKVLVAIQVNIEFQSYVGTIVGEGRGLHDPNTY